MQMQHFKREYVPTPVGDMVVLTDGSGQLRALDWSDFEPRMQRLLRLHYGQDAVTLEDRPTPSEVTRALQA